MSWLKSPMGFRTYCELLGFFYQPRQLVEAMYPVKDAPCIEASLVSKWAFDACSLIRLATLKARNVFKRCFSGIWLFLHMKKDTIGKGSH